MDRRMPLVAYISFIYSFVLIALVAESINFLCAYNSLDAMSRELGHLISLKGGINKDVDVYASNLNLELEAVGEQDFQTVGQMFTYKLSKSYNSFMFSNRLNDISVTRNVVIGIY